MNKIEIPSDIKYSIKEENGRFQPQFRKKSSISIFARDRWVNCVYPYTDGRTGETTMCNKHFPTLKEAEEYIDGIIISESINVYYKDNWK